MTVKKKEKSAHFRGKHFFLNIFFKAAEQLFLPTTGDGMVADGSVGSGPATGSDGYMFFLVLD